MTVPPQPPPSRETPPSPELGLNTFGDVTEGPSGEPLSHAQSLRCLVAEGVLADSAGVDFFGVGEHHRDDEPLGAPEIVMAAVAASTSRIRVGSAVTVLSTDDPVRVYERFATLDAVSRGRAEIIIGRASSIEPYPLFGYELDDYELLSEEKTELFARLLAEKPVSWSGSTRAPLHEQQVYPRTESGALRTWLGVGGSPQSVRRAARHGMPLMIAIISGPPARFRPHTDLYREALRDHGHPALPIGVHSPGHVADSDEQALDEYWPYYTAKMEVASRERGFPLPSRAQFVHETGPGGSYYVGSPETVARKIATTLRTLGASRFDLKYDMGGLPHPRLLRSIELYGTAVAPRVRELLAEEG